MIKTIPRTHLFRGLHQLRCNARNGFSGFILDSVYNEAQSACVDPLAAGVVVLKEERLATVSGDLMDRTAPSPLSTGASRPAGHAAGAFHWHFPAIPH